MEYYLPDALVLIGCRHRTDSMHPEKNSFLRSRKNMCSTGRKACVGPPILLYLGEPNGPAERAQSLV